MSAVQNDQNTDNQPQPKSEDVNHPGSTDSNESNLTKSVASPHPGNEYPQYSQLNQLQYYENSTYGPMFTPYIYYPDYYYMPVMPTATVQNSPGTPPVAVSTPLAVSPGYFNSIQPVTTPPPYAIPYGNPHQPNMVVASQPFQQTTSTPVDPKGSKEGNQADTSTRAGSNQQSATQRNSSSHPSHPHQHGSGNSNSNGSSSLQARSNAGNRPPHQTHHRYYSSPSRSPNSASSSGSRPHNNGGFNMQRTGSNMSGQYRNNSSQSHYPSPSPSTSSSTSPVLGNNRFGHSRSLSNTSNSSVGANNTNIYIRGLRPEATDEWLYDVAKTYGTIVSSKAIIDLSTNTCKGFGFVMYDSEQEARSAMNGFGKMGFQVSFARVRPNTPNTPFNPRIVPGMSSNPNMPLPPGFVRPPFVPGFNSGDSSDGGKSTNENLPVGVWFNPLPADMTEEKFTELLGSAKIIHSRIQSDANDENKRSGFARFETRAEAQEIVEKFHGRTLPGSTVVVSVRIADTPQKKMMALRDPKAFPKASKPNEIYTAYPYYPQPNPMQMHGQMPVTYMIPGTQGMYPMYLPGPYPPMPVPYVNSPQGYSPYGAYPGFDMRSATVTPTPAEASEGNFDVSGVTKMMENGMNISAEGQTANVEQDAKQAEKN